MPTNGTVLTTPTPNSHVVGVTVVAGHPGDSAGRAGEPTPPTGVTAGTPGAFTPPGSAVPANIAAVRSLDLLEEGVDAAWTSGQYVVIGTGNVHWDGDDWATGASPGYVGGGEP